MEKYDYLFGNNNNKKTVKYNKFYIITITLLSINYTFWFWQYNFCTINTHLICSLILIIPIILIGLMCFFTKNERIKVRKGKIISIILIILFLILNFYTLIFVMVKEGTSHEENPLRYKHICNIAGYDKIRFQFPKEIPQDLIQNSKVKFYYRPQFLQGGFCFELLLETDNDIIFTSDKSPCDPKEKYDTFHSNEQLDLPEMIKSCQTFDTERKSSNDSMSNCGSQNDTLSQTSESSFFLSVVNPNKSQTNSTSEGAQNEKKIEKNKKIPFFYRIEEYYRKLMPEKFTEYKKSKNFVSKSSCLKKVDLEPNVEKNEKINMNNKKEENKQNQNTNMLQYQNCFYLSCYGIFYPVNPANFNSFYFNNFSNIFSQK